MRKHKITQAAEIVKRGGIIAYPTEYCFGLGCDPRDEYAVQRILALKQREVSQGLILIAGELSQISDFANVRGLERHNQIIASWPGPTTWVLPALETTPDWITGSHRSVAMRLTDFDLAAQLCRACETAIVSTSANRHGQPSSVTSQQVKQALQHDVDYIIDETVADSSNSQTASAIWDSRTGQQLR